MDWGSNSKTTATCGYTAYGQPIASMTTGADKNNINPGPTDQPYNSYRFNAMRWDSSSGQYDMGFRNYDPGLNQFVSRDMYDGALANMNLTADPFTGSPYAFGQGNPISNIELDGHMPALVGGGGGALTSSPDQTTSGGGCGILWLGCAAHAVWHGLNTGTDWLAKQGSNLVGGVVNGIQDTADFLATPYRWLSAKFINSVPTGVTSSGQLTFTNHATGAVQQSPWHIGNRNSIAYKIGYYGWPVLVPPAAPEDEPADVFAGLNAVRANTGAAVAARLELGGDSFVGTNLARGNAPIKGTFSFFVQHAEGDAFSQAISTGGSYAGQSGTLFVTRAPCGFCVSSISATARSMGLTKLSILTPDGTFGIYTPETGLVREP